MPDEPRGVLLQAWLCDGERDCPDGSDEDSQLCQHRTQHPGDTGRQEKSHGTLQPGETMGESEDKIHCEEHSCDDGRWDVYLYMPVKEEKRQQDRFITHRTISFTILYLRISLYHQQHFNIHKTLSHTILYLPIKLTPTQHYIILFFIFSFCFHINE